MPYFAESGYDAHALSLRGHGKSGGTAGLRHSRVKDYVKDVRSVVERMGTAPILVGHSLGGLVVQKYAERYDTPALVLMASVPVGGIVKMLERLARTHTSKLLRVNTSFSLYPFVSTPRIAREILYSGTLGELELKEYHGKLQDESYFAFLDMLVFTRIRPERVRARVLVMGAHDDRVFYRRDIRRTGRAYGEQAVILPDMAHDMMLEPNWRVAADTILQWLGGLGL